MFQIWHLFFRSLLYRLWVVFFSIFFHILCSPAWLWQCQVVLNVFWLFLFLLKCTYEYMYSMSWHKAIALITGRAHCFLDSYILRLSSVRFEHSVIFKRSGWRTVRREVRFKSPIFACAKVPWLKNTIATTPWTQNLNLTDKTFRRHPGHPLNV